MFPDYIYVSLENPSYADPRQPMKHSYSEEIVQMS